MKKNAGTNMNRGAHEELPPDTITIVEQQAQDLHATGADVLCRSSGLRAGVPVEVAELRTSLEAAGLGADAVAVDALTHESAFGCASSLVAGVAVLVVGVAHVSERALPLVAIVALGGVAAVVLLLAWRLRATHCRFRVRCSGAGEVQKVHRLTRERGIEVFSTEWRYEVDAEALAGWAERCIARARARADRVATALGVTITGVHSYTEGHELPEGHRTGDDGGSDSPQLTSARRRVDAESEGSPSLPLGAESARAYVVVRFRFANQPR